MVRKYKRGRGPAPEVTIIGSSSHPELPEATAGSNRSESSNLSGDLAGSVKLELYGISARSSFTQVYNVIQKLDDCKRNLVRDIGFGGFLDFPCIRSMDRKFVVWLMCRVNPLTQTLHIDERRKLGFCKEDVSKVFCIPVGGSDIKIVTIIQGIRNAGNNSNFDVAGQLLQHADTLSIMIAQLLGQPLVESHARKTLL